MARSRKNPSVPLPLLIGGGVVAAGAAWYFFLREEPTGVQHPGLLAPPTKATVGAKLARLSMAPRREG